MTTCKCIDCNTPAVGNLEYCRSHVLLPFCPDCSDHLEIHWVRYGEQENNSYYIACVDCDYTTEEYESAAGALREAQSAPQPVVLRK
jgi:Zn ribbon nucleic-acid-binding protein